MVMPANMEQAKSKCQRHLPPTTIACCSEFVTNSDGYKNRLAKVQLHRPAAERALISAQVLILHTALRAPTFGQLPRQLRAQIPAPNCAEFMTAAGAGSRPARIQNGFRPRCRV